MFQGEIGSFRLMLQATNKSAKTISTYVTDSVEPFAAFCESLGLADDVTAIERQHVEQFQVS